jgi:hypothetical protein
MAARPTALARVLVVCEVAPGADVESPRLREQSPRLVLPDLRATPCLAARVANVTGYYSMTCGENMDELEASMGHQCVRDRAALGD